MDVSRSGRAALAARKKITWNAATLVASSKITTRTGSVCVTANDAHRRAGSVTVADWLLWGILLIAQNASHTASSRAKNSTSLRYSASTGVLSNGIWFASLYITVGQMTAAKGHPWQIVAVGLFYILMTVGGTVAAHWWLMRFEKRGRL